MLIKTILLGGLLAGVTLVFDDFTRLFVYAPLHYILSCILLIIVYHIFYRYYTPRFLLNASILKFILLLGITTIGYLYLPILICEILPENDFNTSLIDLHLAQQAKIRLGTLMFLALVLGGSILENLGDVHRVRQKLESEKNKAELALLKSQVNPHFLFNSLNSIYYLSYAKNERAPQAIIELSDMMRYVLTKANRDVVLLTEEVDYINKYISLQKLRLPAHTLVESSFTIGDLTSEVAPLLIIPFVENAFKHGVSTRRPTTISIQIESNSEYIVLNVENEVIKSERDAYETKVGIENVKQRLELTYPKAHRLSIVEQKGHFEVELEVRLKPEKE